MAISREEFASLKVGDSVRMSSGQYGRTTMTAGKVVALTKTGVKVKSCGSDCTYIFTAPDKYRGEGAYGPWRSLDTSEEWQRRAAENRQANLRANVHAKLNELNVSRYYWQNVGKAEALAKLDEIREIVLKFGEK